MAPGTPASARWLVPAWLLAGVAVLTAVAVAACAWVVTTRPSDAAVRESTRAAQSAAERAIGPILSYDYRRLDQDQKAAESYMTSSYRKKYAPALRGDQGERAADADAWSPPRSPTPA